MTAKILYTGNLRTELTHIQSGSKIETDAPTDNFGRGEKFSPTDLLAVSLGSCMLTTMALAVRNSTIDLTGTLVDVTKIMSKDAPRRVVEIVINFQFMSNLSPSQDEKSRLERVAHNCPVQKSLHPDIMINCQFNW